MYMIDDISSEANLCTDDGNNGGGDQAGGKSMDQDFLANRALDGHFPLR